jgi:hypothetical protein
VWLTFVFKIRGARPFVWAPSLSMLLLITSNPPSLSPPFLSCLQATLLGLFCWMPGFNAIWLHWHYGQMVSRLVVGGARAAYVADCCAFYGAYCGACCGCWCCFHQLLVFVDNHTQIIPMGLVADEGERDFGPLGSVEAGDADAGEVELANRQHPPQHTQTPVPPAAWTQPAPANHPQAVPIAMPPDAEGFVRAIPSFQASLQVSQILEGMRVHRSALPAPIAIIVAF